MTSTVKSPLCFTHRAPMFVSLALLPYLFACEGQLVEFPLDASDRVHSRTVKASATAKSVDSPDYTLDTTGLTLLTDAHDIVQSATGSAILSTGLVTGQTYAVVNATGLNTYGALDEAFSEATDEVLTLDIPAEAFALVHDDLNTPKTRTLIIANIASGVPSYQVFEVTFHPMHDTPAR